MTYLCTMTCKHLWFRDSCFKTRNTNKLRNAQALGVKGFAVIKKGSALRDCSRFFEI